MTTLTEFLAAFRPQPFEWDSANCCHFGAAWVEVREGTNPMAGLMATPSALAARRLVRQLGGTLEAAWSQRLGRPSISARHAQAGDLVLLPTPLDSEHPGVGAAVGICIGDQAAFAYPTALALLPVRMCTRAWRIK